MTAAAPQLIHATLAQLNKVILGKEQQVRLALTCLLVNGHLLLEDLPGMGKTTLAHILATEMGVNIKVTSGPAIERAGDLAAILTEVKRVFPHALEVHFEYGGERVAMTGVGGQAAVVDPVAVLCEFVEQVSNAKPDAAERLVLQRAHEEVLAGERSL